MNTAVEWEWRVTDDGSWTLAHPEHGQACHSHSGAWTESLERYARACGLGEYAASGRRRDAADRVDVRLLDVGFGLGLNVAAAARVLAGPVENDANGPGPRLICESFECSLPILRATAARREPIGPPECERWHRPLRELLVRALDRSPSGGGTLLLEGSLGPVRLSLRLHLGDAREAIARVAPDFAAQAVFLDPFSPTVEPELWHTGFLRELCRRTAPEGILSTYTVALVVRSALARAGFRVGSGPMVGQKRAGTLASPGRELPPLPEKHARFLPPGHVGRGRPLADGAGRVPSGTGARK